MLPSFHLDNTALKPYTTCEYRCFLSTFTPWKTELAKKAKALNLDAIHDTVHEMARDEARHGKAFKGLLERYFGK